MNAHNTSLELPSPIDNGWILKNGMLEQQLMSQVQTPKKVAEFVLCRCKKNCKTIVPVVKEKLSLHRNLLCAIIVKIGLGTVKVIQIQKTIKQFLF